MTKFSIIYNTINTKYDINRVLPFNISKIKQNSIPNWNRKEKIIPTSGMPDNIRKIIKSKLIILFIDLILNS